MMYERVLVLERLALAPVPLKNRPADGCLLTIMDGFGSSGDDSMLKAGRVLGSCMSAGTVQPQLVLAACSQHLRLARLVVKEEVAGRRPMMSSVDERWATVRAHAPLALFLCPG